MARLADEGEGDAAREEARAEARRSVRLHAALDLVFAALYAWIGFVVAPSRNRLFSGVLAIVVVLLAAAGFSLASGLRFARRLALLAHSLLLAFCAVTIVLLVASAAYLRGIYGPLGEGAAAISLVIAALVIEACGLLPLFQIRLLLRAEVRRLFDGAPRGDRAR